MAMAAPARATRKRFIGHHRGEPRPRLPLLHERGFVPLAAPHGRCAAVPPAPALRRRPHRAPTCETPTRARLRGRTAEGAIWPRELPGTAPQPTAPGRGPALWPHPT